MSGTSRHTPSQPLAAAVVSIARPAFFGIACVSGVVNLLALTAPLFMLQVYDRVLTSRSLPTLIGLAALAAGLYAFQALLDIIRSRVLLRIGEAFDNGLSGHVHRAVVRLPLETRLRADEMQPLRDLDHVRGFLASQGPAAFFDLPWVPLYLGICFLFHFWIGMTALAGALVLFVLTLLADILSRQPTREAVRHGMIRNARMEAARRNAEVISAMGLEPRIAARWREVNARYLSANRRAGDVASTLGGISKALRLMLQSALLAVGAWLVIEQQLSSGAMIASSIMMGRALAPVDLAIASWRGLLAARQSWTRLKELLHLVPEAGVPMALPRPERELGVNAITVVPPGGARATIIDVSFDVSGGSALAIIGPSGSGKSTLARALVGAWRPSRGRVQIDGAGLDQWERESLGRHIGYLPQDVELFEGTIAENIARFEEAAPSEAIVAAAKAAGVHDLIVSFENGYETAIGESGSALSAGQRQRVGLARALYGNPFLVVLDEPNAHLDAEGEAALGRAVSSVRERRGIVGELAVSEGQRVAVGDVLLRLDATQTRANLAMIAKRLDELAARQARLEAERDDREEIVFPAFLLARSGETDIAAVPHSERSLFAFRGRAREGKRSQLRERIAQYTQEIAGLKAQQAAHDRGLTVIEQELAGLRTLQDKGLVTVQRINALDREAARLAGDRGEAVAGQAQAAGRIAEMNLQILQVDIDLKTEVAGELRDVQSQAGEFSERKVAAEDQLRRIDILAPQSGIVHQLAVHTVGGVVAPADAIMFIVPDTDRLSLEARITPSDIDQVHIGQKAVLRMSAFNQRTTPELSGTVIRIAADLTQDERTGLSFYLVRIAVEQARLGGLTLLPGMPAEAFIQTGERTALSYLLKPLRDQISRAFKEE
jgi:PrtD family type I secretion system ABC transporter/HlyD family type I secretion membrane fusion protein